MKIKKTFYLLAAYLLFCTSSYLTAQALGFVDYSNSPDVFDWKHNVFLTPNESKPEQIFPMLKQIKGDILIGVGTERMFIDAANSSATHLLMVDYSAAAVNYNRLNILFLKAAHNFEGTLEEKMARFNQLKMDANFFWNCVNHPQLCQNPWKGFTEREMKLLSSIRITSDWNDIVQRMKKEDFYLPDAKAHENGSYRGAKYWQEPEQFKKLMEMAASNRIQVEKLDLNSEKEVGLLMSAIKKSGLTIAGIDISNAHWHSYTPKLASTLPIFIDGFTKNTLLIGTWPYAGNSGYFAFNKNGIRQFVLPPRADVYEKTSGLLSEGLKLAEAANAVENGMVIPSKYIPPNPLGAICSSVAAKLFGNLGRKNK